MVHAIIHRVSQQILEKYDASSVEEAREQYLRNHPELECDTVNEMNDKYPALTMNLWIIPLH